MLDLADGTWSELPPPLGLEWLEDLTWTGSALLATLVAEAGSQVAVASLDLGRRCLERAAHRTARLVPGPSGVDGRAARLLRQPRRRHLRPGHDDLDGRGLRLPGEHGRRPLDRGAHRRHELPLRAGPDDGRLLPGARTGPDRGTGARPRSGPGTGSSTGLAAVARKACPIPTDTTAVRSSSTPARPTAAGSMLMTTDRRLAPGLRGLAAAFAAKAGVSGCDLLPTPAPTAAPPDPPCPAGRARRPSAWLFVDLRVANPSQVLAQPTDRGEVIGGHVVELGQVSDLDWGQNSSRWPLG